jgi:hypothetical protein
MKLTASTIFVIVVAVLLGGCTMAPVPKPDPTTLWSPGPCIGDVSYPELRVWALNESLPIEGVAIEYVQTEIAVGRGPGSCAAPWVQPLSAECPVEISPADGNLDVMLGYTLNEITTSEYALGARGAITEVFSGYSANDGTFEYRMTAWHYASPDAAEQTKILDIVGACDGAIRDRDQVAVYEGDEPHRVAYIVDDTVYLIESLRPVARDGTVGRIQDTASGLLPAEAIAMIRTWWTEQVTAFYWSEASAA